MELQKNAIWPRSCSSLCHCIIRTGETAVVLNYHCINGVLELSRKPTDQVLYNDWAWEAREAVETRATIAQQRVCKFTRVSQSLFPMEITAVTLSALWGIFVPRQKTYQIKAGENCVNKDHCVTMQIYIEPLWGEKRKFGLCRRSKIWIPAAKFDEFYKRKFDKRGILFCAVFVFYLYVNYSAELDVHLNCGSLRDFPEP